MLSIVKYTYKGTVREYFLFRCGHVPFRTRRCSFDPRGCNGFPLKTGFPYVQVTFKTGSAV